MKFSYIPILLGLNTNLLLVRGRYFGKCDEMIKRTKYFRFCRRCNKHDQPNWSILLSCSLSLSLSLSISLSISRILCLWLFRVTQVQYQQILQSTQCKRSTNMETSSTAVDQKGERNYPQQCIWQNFQKNSRISEDIGKYYESTKHLSVEHTWCIALSPDHSVGYLSVPIGFMCDVSLIDGCRHFFSWYVWQLLHACVLLFLLSEETKAGRWTDG